MSLSCEWEYGPVVMRTIYRKARKQHMCCECGKQILVGETYEYISGVWDGGPDSFHTCEKCADLRDSMAELGFCPTFGELLSEHAEYVAEYVAPNNAVLSGAATEVKPRSDV